MARASATSKERPRLKNRGFMGQGLGLGRLPGCVADSPIRVLPYSAGLLCRLTLPEFRRELPLAAAGRAAAGTAAEAACLSPGRPDPTSRAGGVNGALLAVRGPAAPLRVHQAFWTRRRAGAALAG